MCIISPVPIQKYGLVAPKSSKFGTFGINLYLRGKSIERFLQYLAWGVIHGSVSAFQISPLYMQCDDGHTLFEHIFIQNQNISAGRQGGKASGEDLNTATESAALNS